MSEAGLDIRDQLERNELLKDEQYRLRNMVTHPGALITFSDAGAVR